MPTVTFCFSIFCLCQISCFHFFIKAFLEFHILVFQKHYFNLSCRLLSASINDFFCQISSAWLRKEAWPKNKPENLHLDTMEEGSKSWKNISFKFYFFRWLSIHSLHQSLCVFLGYPYCLVLILIILVFF